MAEDAQEQRQKTKVAIPEALKGRVQTIAVRERRTFTAQVLYFLERAVEQDDKQRARKGLARDDD
jgi:hypothetical protein